MAKKGKDPGETQTLEREETNEHQVSADAVRILGEMPGTTQPLDDPGRTQTLEEKPPGLEEETESKSVLQPAHETLLQAAKDVIVRLKDMPDHQDFQARLEEDDVSNKEKDRIAKMQEALNDAITEMRMQMKSRVIDDIPVEHVPEVINTLLEVCRETLGDWPREVLDFFTNHGTNLDAIENFLGEEWEVKKNCVCGRNHVRQISFIKGKMESLSGMIGIPMERLGKIFTAIEGGETSRAVTELIQGIVGDDKMPEELRETLERMGKSDGAGGIIMEIINRRPVSEGIPETLDELLKGMDKPPKLRGRFPFNFLDGMF